MLLLKRLWGNFLPLSESEDCFLFRIVLDKVFCAHTLPNPPMKPAKSDIKVRSKVRQYEETMGHSGLRLTRQRRMVYDALMGRRDHPTATDIFLRVQKKMPTISLATVYNCLDTLVDCGLVRQVNVGREPTRYCPNKQEHGHFVCTKCGHVFDVDLSPARLAKACDLPAGYETTAVEVTLRGLCPTCNKISQ